MTENKDDFEGTLIGFLSNKRKFANELIEYKEKNITILTKQELIDKYNVIFKICSSCFFS